MESLHTAQRSQSVHRRRSGAGRCARSQDRPERKMTTFGVGIRAVCGSSEVQELIMP